MNLKTKKCQQGAWSTICHRLFFISEWSLFIASISIFILLSVHDGGIAAAVIGREPTNERLAKESLAVINGFGDALFEAVCRDAFDGLNVSRVSLLH